jgi:16S rRNA (guanine527-N7)-methyltransferase
MTEDEAKNWLIIQLKVSRETLGQLDAFVNYLTREAASQNLISKSTIGQMWARHIVDSAQLLKLLPDQHWNNWLDLGSGAGFPGLIIAILTQKPVTLLESRARRIEYLQRAVQLLDLEKTVDVAGMTLDQMKTQEFSAISARAFAPLPRLLNGAARFSTENTIWLLPKGKNAARELSEARKVWHLDFDVVPSITEKEAGILVGKLRTKRTIKL